MTEKPVSDSAPSAKQRLRFVTQNARFEHVFVVVRTWRSLPDEDVTVDDIKMGISLTKAFLTEGEANTEAARLNELNGDQWLYFVDLARLVDDKT